MAVGTTAFPTALDDAVTLPIPENNASSTITTGIDTDDLLITIDDPDEFPDAGEFTIVDSLTAPTKIENVKIESRSGSNFTVEAGGRGAGGTTAQTWTSGAFIECRPNKGYYLALRSAILAIQAKLGTGEYINANRITDGSISDAEFGYLNGVTSSIQAQLDAKQAAFGSQTANLVYAGPTSGGAASPAFRALVAADIPDLSSVYSVTSHNHSGVYQPIDQDLTDIAALSADGLLRRSSGTWAMDSASYLTDFGDQVANTVYAGPTTGVDASPTFRALVAADIPDVSATYLTVSTAASTYQPLDATLTALAAYNTNGLLTQTAADTFTGRTITGTSNKIDVANGDGVSGNPTLTISSTYVGQTSITTLGTIATGTWNGTAIGAQYGGTGLNTSASTGYPSLSTGTWSIVSATTLTAALNAMVGDSGSGGTKGLVPAPASGDAAAGKFLKADGTWAAPAGGGSGTVNSGSQYQFAYYASAGTAVSGTNALVTDASGLIGINKTSSIGAQLHVVSGSASLPAAIFASAVSPTADVMRVSADNGTTTHFKVTSAGAPSSPGGSGSERFGDGSVASGSNSSVFGNSNNITGNGLWVLGKSNTASTSFGNIAIIGNNQTVTGSVSNVVHIAASGLSGYGSNNIGILTTGLPSGTFVNNIFIGGGHNIAGQTGTTLIGFSSGTTAGISYSAGIGFGTTLTGSNQFVSGSSTGPINDVYFGKGVTNATPTSYTVNGTGGSGSNIAGAALQLAGGKGTGTGTGGDINFQFARAGSTGSSLNSLATIFAMSGTTTATTLTQTNVNGATTITGQVTESITLNTGGTTTDSTIDLPANSIILSVTARITTTITTATAWRVGDATVDDRFTSDNSTLTSGTTDVGINQWKADRTTAGQGPYQASTAKVRITTTGTPGAGVIRITIHYITLTAPTS